MIHRKGTQGEHILLELIKYHDTLRANWNPRVVAKVKDFIKNNLLTVDASAATSVTQALNILQLSSESSIVKEYMLATKLLHYNDAAMADLTSKSTSSGSSVALQKADLAQFLTTTWEQHPNIDYLVTPNPLGVPQQDSGRVPGHIPDATIVAQTGKYTDAMWTEVCNRLKDKFAGTGARFNDYDVHVNSRRVSDRANTLFRQFEIRQSAHDQTGAGMGENGEIHVSEQQMEKLLKCKSCISDPNQSNNAQQVESALKRPSGYERQLAKFSAVMGMQKEAYNDGEDLGRGIITPAAATSRASMATLLKMRREADEGISGECGTNMPPSTSSMGAELCHLLPVLWVLIPLMHQAQYRV